MEKVHENNAETKALSSKADEIIAIAQKVAKECPDHFEQVFKAIIDRLYIH